MIGSYKHTTHSRRTGPKWSRWVTLVRFFCALCFASGCADAFVGEDAPDTPAENFRAFWGEFDRLYAFFDLKEIEWSDVRAMYGPRADAARDQDELLQVFTEIVQLLDDGHVFLLTPDTLIRSERPPDVAEALDLHVVASYAGAPLSVVGDGKIFFGRIGGSVGYVHVSSWTDKGGALSAVGDWVYDFDTALEALGDVEGLILDVRNNSGGSYFNGRFVAGRFTEEPVLATHSQFRSGRRHSDFTSLEKWYVLPQSPTFEQPVALLTNGGTASAAEWFVLAMREMDAVIQIGSTTAGAMGTRIRRVLPNGWVYGLPVQRLYTADLRLLEDVGIDPDVHVLTSVEDVEAGRDPVLDAALRVLAGPGTAASNKG